MYFPRYKMESKAMKIEKITGAKREAKKYLKYVYIGNLGGGGCLNLKFRRLFYIG